MEPSRDILSKAFTFSQHLLASCRGRLLALYDVPRQAIALLLILAWGSENTAWLSNIQTGTIDCIQHTVICPPSYMQASSPGEPSKLSDYYDTSTASQSPKSKEEKSEFEEYKCEPDSYRSALGFMRGDLDPTQRNHGQITLTWHRQAAEFKRDFDVFVWQQYQKEPEPDFVSIFCPPTSSGDFSFVWPSSSNQSARMIIMFKSAAQLTTFNGIRRSSQMFSSTPTSTSWSVVSEQLLAILAVYYVMVHDLTLFTRSTFHQIRVMVMLQALLPTRGFC